MTKLSDAVRLIAADRNPRAVGVLLFEESPQIGGGSHRGGARSAASAPALLPPTAGWAEALAALVSSSISR